MLVDLQVEKRAGYMAPRLANKKMPRARRQGIKGEVLDAVPTDRVQFILSAPDLHAPHFIQTVAMSAQSIATGMNSRTSGARIQPHDMSQPTASARPFASNRMNINVDMKPRNAASTVDLLVRAARKISRASYQDNRSPRPVSPTFHE